MRDHDRPEDASKKEKKAPGDEALDENEGEGSTSAARRYAEELEDFKQEKNVEELAEEAARELDDDEGEK